jgi:ABC-2 type transport system permease protein
MTLIRLKTAVKREVERFLRVPIQTLISPWISALLYIFIFGSVIGSRINFLEDISYIDFVLPGVLMMNLIQSAFGQSSSSLFFHKFSRAIEEILSSPLSYIEMVLGYVIGSIARATVVGTGIYALALFFTQASMENFLLFLFFTITVSVIFSLLGLLVALWAKKFEHLTILQTFVITPLIYFGGMFNSIDMLPPALQVAARWNPFFYMVDGLRYSMIGYSESNLLLGAVGIGALALILFLGVTYLFRIGWRLRN